MKRTSAHPWQRLLLLAGALLAGAVFAVPAWGQFGQRVVLSDSWVVLTEGKSKTFTVKLATRPSNGPQQVTLIVTGESYVTVSPTSLTFTTIDWNFPQTVTVRAYHDTDKADDTATVNLTGLGITSGSVSVTVDDDDDVDVGLKLSALDSLNEGGSKTFTVKLAAKPGNARRVTLAVTGDSDVTVSPASLDFTTTNWNTAQTVTVRAAQDADKHHEIAEIAFSGDQIGYASLSVRIDDDEADIELDIKDFPLGSLAEGSSHTFQVKLKTHPGAAGRTVSVSSSNSDVTISPASLNFTASNWNDWKTVTLTAAQDADSVDDFVRFGLSGNQIRGESRTVRIADDGTFAGLSIYPSFPAFTMYEGGISYAPKVSLNRNPGANRTVNISSSNPDVTVSPASLIFTPSNWSQPQTVSFTGVQDADSDDETALITFSGNQIGIESFSITVRDDDGDAVLDISSSSFPSHLFEGSSDTFGVRLSRKPGANRTVNMSSSNSDVTVSPASLNFTPANWSQPQTVTLTAAQDADSDDERFALIAFSGDQIRSESHSVLIADDDNDGDAELDISWFSSLSPLREGVGSTTLRVRLKIKPGASRTVNMSSSNPDVTVSPASLTFTPSNWSDWKTVTLTAAQDADSDDETAVIAVSGNQIGIESRSVKVLDDDGDAELHPSSFPSHLFEGSSNTFSVGLRVKPGANRTVSMSSSNSDVTVSPASLTFTPSNWNKNQTVTLTAAQDADSDDEFALIAFSGEQIGGDSRSRSIRIFDDDADAGVNLSSFPFSLGEGGSDTFSVRLTRKPGANRTVNVSSGNPDVTVSPSSLSFTASNWSQSQTVTLRVAQDADSDDELAVIVFSGNQIRGESRSVRVNDDEADVEPAVSGFPSYLSEGSSGTFSVRLSRKPSANRTVNMSSSNPDVTLSPASLNFTASNWNKHQTVTLTAAQDADNDHDFGVIAFSGNQIRSQSRSVKVHDDEADIGLNISHFPSDSLVEGRSNNFYVGLKTNPGAAGRTVSISSSNPDVTVSPASLIFTPSNWNERQSVGLRTVQDADSDDDLGVIAFTGSQIRGASKSIKIYESAVGLNISQNSLALDEGESKTFTVKLASKPGNARKVMLTVSGDADVTVSPASLDFTTTNWNTAQNVTVRAADDSDKTKDTVRINLFGGGITAGSVSVTVADDDDVAVGLRLSQLDTLTEGGGGSKTLTVKLAAQPGSARKVTLAVTGDADVTVSPASLNFSTSNWDRAQAVTVSAADDADKTDDTATINLTGDGITASSVSVSVDDDDDSDVGLTLSALETLAEGGSKTFTVKLAAQPGNARKVMLAVTGDADVTVSPVSLNFTTSNWDRAQAVTVSAADDADKTDDTATINLTGDGITAGSVSVTVDDDDDSDVGLTLSDLETLTEGGSKTFTVKLAAKPGNARRVTLAVTGDDDVTVSPASLDFTTTSWNTAQTVTVRAAQDADKTDDTATINLTGDGITAGSVSVMVDDDEDPVVGLTLSDLETLAEGGSKTFTVKLAAQPENARKVTLAVTGDNDVTVSPASLDFSTSNWSTAQTVTVRAADDTDQADDTATVNLTGDGITSGSVSVTVDDDEDTADIGLKLSALDSLNEGGSKTFTVKLTARPVNARKVTLAVTGDSDVTVSPTSLDFTTSNWNTNQTVTVRAADDTDQADDTATVNLTGDGITAGSVSVTVLDDDIGLTLSDLETLTEGGSKTFTVKLAVQPSNAREVTLAVTGDNDVTVSPASLDFSTSNWSTAQTVTVRAADDTDQADDTATVNLTGDGITTASVSVTVLDDDIGLTLSDLDTLTEGGSKTFTVKLAVQPGNVRKVMLAVGGSSDVTVSPASLDFTTTGWNTAQTVTVRAAHDADKTGDTATINLTGDGITGGSVSVTVIDDEEPRLILRRESFRLPERHISFFGVKLSKQPTGNVTVAAQSSNANVVQVRDTDRNKAGYQNTRTFTTSNWNVYQQFPITAPADVDTANNSAAVSLTASGGGYDAATASMPVTVLDGDLVELSASSLWIEEGSSGTFTVGLAAQPSENVSLSFHVSSRSNSDITFSAQAGTLVSGSTLTFKPSNWSQVQTVTVRVAHDADSAHDFVSILFTLPGGGSKSLSVNAVDDENDKDGLTLSANSLMMDEGGSKTFTVKFAADPGHTLIFQPVTLAVSGDDDVTVSPASLDFTTTGWNTAQTVTVRAAHDADKADDTATINLTGAGLTSGSVSVTVADDDDVDVGLTLSALETVTEGVGGSKTFTVRLAVQPGNARRVMLAVIDNSDVTVSPTSLDFTASNWNTAQTVTVSAADDSDRADDTATVNLTGDGITAGSVSVTVLDDDIGLTLSDLETLTEGGSKTFTVKLTARPVNARRVTLAVTGDSDVTVSPTSLDFTTSNWSQPQTVTVRVAHDSDSNDEFAVIALSGSQINGVRRSIPVHDDDADIEPAVSGFPSHLSEGGSDTFQVRLGASPGAAGRTVSMSSSNPDVTVSPASLNFTASNWNDGQTVTLTAAQDADSNDELAAIAFSGSQIRGESRSVSVHDDDADIEPAVSGFPSEMVEGGSDTFQVRLGASPGAAGRTVSMSSSNSDVTVSPASLSFTASNWNKNQTVTLTAAQDADNVYDTAVIVFSGSRIRGESHSVRVSDDEHDIWLDIRDSLRLNEGGSSTVRVRLQLNPGTAGRTVNISSSNPDVTVSPASLNFTASNWDDYQTVTLTAAHDADNESDVGSIAFRGSQIIDRFYLFSVNDDEDDDSGGRTDLNIDNYGYYLAEGGSETIRVSLNRNPGAAGRTVNMSSDNPDVTVSPASLNFTASNWDDDQTVTVTVAHDSDSDDEYAVITFRGNQIWTDFTNFEVHDDERDVLLVIGRLSSLTEGGSVTYIVRLRRNPGAAVRTVNMSSDNPDVTVSPASLNFTASNWNRTQTVTLTAAQDADSDDEFAVIAFSGSKVQGTTRSVKVNDDDGDIDPAISGFPSYLAEGGSGTFTVRLKRKPGANRTVNMSSSNSDVTVSPASLNFTPANWDTGQTVTLRAAQDADKDHDVAVIAFSGSHIRGESHSVKVHDDEADVELGISGFPSGSLGSLVEGSSDTFYVKLETHPGTAGRTVSMSSGNSDVTVSPASLNFTASNWNRTQTVTLTAAQDADSNDDFGAIAFRGSQIRGESHSVWVRDDEVDDIELDISGLSFALREGGSDTFRVRLKAHPGAAGRRVRMSSSDSDVTVSPTSLGFTSLNWDAAQTVTISAPDDADKTDETATISLTGGGITTGSVSVTVADDDDDAVGLTLSDLETLTEGGSKTFTVQLAAQPGNARKVTLAVTGDDDVTVSPTELDFTTTDWSTAQTVTVSAADDTDQADDTATVNLTGDGITSGSVSVTVDDDDDDAVGLTLSALETLTEGGSKTFTVQLAAQPGNARKVTLAVTGDDDVTVSPTELDFTTTNWSTAQTVTVSAGQDADKADDTATISLTGGRITSGSVSVTVDDDEDVAVGLTLSDLETLTEGVGGSKTFTVQLAAQPGNARKVTLAVTGDNDVTVSPTELDFTTSDWSTAQTVTVSAADDTDKADDTATINLTGDGITAGSVSVVVDDDEDVDVGLTLSALETLTEGGSKTFTVQLAAQPGNARKVTLAVAGDDDVTVTPTELDFTTTDWSSAQTVTVSADQDADKVHEASTINLTGDGITAASVSVAVDDDDDVAVGLTLSALDTLTEGGGGSRTFTVQLAAQPGNDRRITLAVTGDVDVTVSPTELDFFPTDWSTAQTVTVSAADDTDQADDTATVNLTGDGITSGSVGVTVDDDDDSSVGLMLSDLETLTEGGSKTFTVQLAAQPGNARKVTLAVTGDDDVTVSPTELDFTTTDWSSAQTVTVSAADDTDQADDTATVNLTGDGITAGSVDVTVDDDDDDAVGLTLSALDTLTEGGSKTFTVQLAAQPGNARKVTLAVTGDADVTVSPTELDFTTTDWGTAQTVTVSAADDTDQADDTATVNLTGDGITAGSVDVTVDDDDDDAVGLTLSDLETLTEGGSKTFTVQLAAQPGNARKVTLAVTGDDDVTVSPTELDFTTTDWSTAQTVTVSAADDTDQADDTATVNLTGDGITTGSVSVTVDDDDDSSVGLTLSALETVTEGGSKTFTVQLAAQPGNARKVTLAVAGDDDVTVTPTELDFTTTDWSTAQTVTVRAADDTDQADDTATVNLTGDGITAGSVAVTVDDDDDASVGLMLSALEILTEGVGGSKTFTVRLAAQPGNARKVTLAVAGDADVTVSPTELDFTTTDWSTAQTVTVSAADDTDQADDTATVNLTGDGITAGSVSVVVDDDEDVDVGLTLSALETLTEGGSKTFTVQLAAQPGNARKVTLAVTGDDDVTVSPTELDFTTTDWSTAQTVTVSAADDTDQADDTATVNLTGDGITAGSVSVVVDDDDDSSVGLTLSALETVTEGGSKTFTVNLAAQPGNARKVTLAVDGDDDVTVSPTELDFTTTDWSTAQTVTVSAADDTDQADDTATVNLTGDGITAGSVDVTVDDDDDDAVGLTLSDLETLTEGGSKTFTVQLAAQPGNARKVTLAVTGDDDVTVSPTELDFTTANWNTAQTVTVSAADDTDQTDDTATIDLTGDGITTASVSVAVDDDDDSSVGLTLSALETLTEGGSKTFTVQLAAQPGNARKVTLAVTGDDDVTVSPTELDFTTSDWGTAQTVTVRAADDTDQADDTATVNLTGDGITTGSVSVAVDDDDDDAVGLTLSALETVTEGGSKTFTVQLAAQPGNARKVTLAVDGDDDVTVTPNELDFTTTDWSTAQTVTVSAADDTDQADDTATVNLTGDGITAGSVSVTVDDDDDASVGLTLSDLDDLTEGGSKTFTVQLAAQPGNARKVTLAVTGDNDVTVTPNELDFTTTDWGTAQTVTVSAADDTDQADDTATVNLTGDGITAGSVSVTVDDDDDSSVGLTLSALEILTEGGSKTFTVQLAAQPGNARKVTLAVTGDDDVTVSPTELDFTTTDWNTAQTVTVSAADDTDQADDTATINLTGDGITAGSVSVSVDDDDDDAVGLTLSALETLTEGGSKTFTVQLAAQPGNARKVTLAVTGDSDVTVSPTELDFTTSDWSTAQTVTVSAADDTDQADDTATVNLTGDGITAGSVSVTVDDDDDSDVGLTLSDLETLTEGGSKTFTVQLAAQPGNARKVTLAVTGDSDVTVSPTELDFTTSDWSTAQTVTVSAADDTDQADDTATVNLTGDGITAGSVSVAVDDDDDSDVGLTLSALEILTEGGSKTFTVQLSAQPGNARKVTLAVDGDDDVTVSPTELDFTTTDWSTAQTVTVSAADDTDQADDTATVNLTGDGITTGSVSVTVDDDDDASVGLTLSDLETLTEGGSKTFTVQLAAQPGNARKVTLAVTGDDDVTVSPVELDFTTTDWSTAQTVTVSAADDTDQTDDTATVNLTGDGITAASVSVSVDDDDDSSVGLTLSDLETVTEGGSKTFTVQLAAQPGNARKVTLGVTGDDDVTVSPTELDFTTTDWSTAQTVTVSAADDTDQVDDTATINLTGDGITSGSVDVTVDDDDDDAVGLTLSDLETLTEGGSKTFTVQLAAQPGNARKVTLAVTGDDDVTVSPTELDFTTSDWSTAQTVTVSADQDTDQADDSATINLTGDGITTGSVEVTVTDDDADVELVLSQLAPFTEGGLGTFAVSLAEKPGNARRVDLTVIGDEDITVNPASLDFTTDNWDTGQLVIVRAAQDDDQDDDTAAINLTGTGITAGSVDVTVTDDDTDVGLKLSETSLAVSEGAGGLFTVQLTEQPSNSRTINLTSSNADVTLSPASLNFTVDNWDAAQDVTVSAGQDDDQDDDTATISLTGTGITAGSVEVTVTDDDADVELVLSQLAPFTEGGLGTFAVSLAEKPGNARRVDLTVIGDEDITVNPASLNFTTDNWDTGQLVIVRAAQDDDKTDDTATINLTGTGIIAASVEVSVTDDDVNTMPEEEEETVKLQLAEIAGSLLSSTSDVIKIRLDAPRGGRSAVVDGQQLALDRSLMQDIAAGFASRAGGQDAAVQSRFASGRFGAERQSADWLGGIVLEEGRPVRSEAHSTSGMGEAAALLSSFSYALAPNTEGGSGWSVWGRFDTRDFSGSTAENAEFDGSQSGFWLGFDTNTNERVSFGLALGSASADSAYTLGSASGNLDTTMTTVLPYLELKSEGGSTARVILGLGSGEVTLMQTSQSEISADVSMELMAISGSWPVAQLGSSTLSWTGDLGISSLKPETGQEPNALDGLDVASTRFRGGMELEHGGFGSTWKTAPRFGLSVRHDGGDGATGTGVELTAGLQMRSSEERFSLDISLRTLGMHSAEDMTDTSASVEFRLNSRPSGEGMSFTLGPYWGAAEDGLLERDEAFRLDQADMSHRRQRQQERGVAAKLAYGLRGLGGMLEPYSEYDFTSGEYGSMRQVTGVKFSRFDTLELRLFSERQVSGQSPVRSKLRVELKKQF